MSNFRPNRYYIREMKNFGVLSASLPDDIPVDPYATDQAYWKTFHGELNEKMYLSVCRVNLRLCYR